jgi:hypothetical protein
MNALQKEISAMADSFGFKETDGNGIWLKGDPAHDHAEIFIYTGRKVTVWVSNYKHTEWELEFTNSTPKQVYRHIIAMAAAFCK